MTACQTLNIFHLRLFLVGKCFYTPDFQCLFLLMIRLVAAIKTSAGKFFLLWMNEQRIWGESFSSVTRRGGCRRWNYFHPTRKIFMKEKCPDIFLLEPKQRDRQRVDTAGNCKDLGSQKIFRKNRYLEKIAPLLLFSQDSHWWGGGGRWWDWDICGPAGAGEIPPPGNRNTTHIMSLTNRATDRRHGASRKYFRISKLAPLSSLRLNKTQTGRNGKDCSVEWMCWAYDAIMDCTKPALFLFKWIFISPFYFTLELYSVQSQCYAGKSDWTVRN